MLFHHTSLPDASLSAVIVKVIDLLNDLYFQSLCLTIYYIKYMLVFPEKDSFLNSFLQFRGRWLYIYSFFD